MRKTAQSGRLSSAGATEGGMTNKCSDNSAGDLILRESIPPKIIELSGVWVKSIDFETEVGKGTKFIIKIPMKKEDKK